MTTPVDASMMNPVELFMTAHWVVKSVMVGLALAAGWLTALLPTGPSRTAQLSAAVCNWDPSKADVCASQSCCLYLL